MARQTNRHPLRSPRGLLVFLALLLCLLLAGSASAATYDYSPSGGDDVAAIERLIQQREAAGGGVVSLAPGTYRADSDIDLRPNVTLDGNGAVIAQTTANTRVIDIVNDTNAGVRNLTLRGVTIGILVDNSRDILLENITTEGGFYGVRYQYSSQVTVRNHVSRGDIQSMTAKWTTDSTWTDLDFDCVISGNGHNIYLERGNADLTFTNVRLAGGGGYSLHLYHEGTTAEDSKRIAFRNVWLDNPTQGVVVWGFDDVTIENLYGSALEGYSTFMLNDLERLTVDGLDLAGTPAAFAAYSNLDGPIADVTLRNGVYHQDTLVSNADKISGLAIENVAKAGETTATTQAPTTTTAAPTTSTTTTQAPTTTAAPTTSTTKVLATTSPTGSVQQTTTTSAILTTTTTDTLSPTTDGTTTATLAPATTTTTETEAPNTTPIVIAELDGQDPDRKVPADKDGADAPKEGACFLDLQENNPYYEAIRLLEAYGIVDGFETAGGFEFRTQSQMKRVQFAKMVVMRSSWPFLRALARPSTISG